MMTQSKKIREHNNAELAALVNRYATPLAILLVSLGVGLSQPRSPIMEIAYGLLIFSAVFNIWSIRWMKEQDSAPIGFIKLRMYINFAVNVVFLYYLGPYWTPIWLLLVLSPVAAAIYGNSAATIKSASAAALVILAVHLSRENTSALSWGIEIAKVAFIYLFSLMVNALSDSKHIHLN